MSHRKRDLRAGYHEAKRSLVANFFLAGKDRVEIHSDEENPAAKSKAKTFAGGYVASVT